MKSKLGIALLWILVFLLGGVAGAVSHCLYQEHAKPATNSMIPPKPPDVVGWMVRELQLDERQKDSLKSIFSESRKRYRALGEQYKPQWEAIRNQTDERIKQMLNAGQKTRFEALLKKVYAPPPKQKPPQDSK